MTTSIVKEKGMWHVRIWLHGVLRFELWSSGSKHMAEAIASQEATRMSIDSGATMARSVVP